MFTVCPSDRLFSVTVEVIDEEAVFVGLADLLFPKLMVRFRQSVRCGSTYSGLVHRLPRCYRPLDLSCRSRI